MNPANETERQGVPLKTLACVVLTLALTSCGYRVGNNAGLLPPSIKTVAVPAFINNTTRYKLTDLMPDALAREFIGHTRYRVVTDPSQADMVLRGGIISYGFFPTIFDLEAQRANVAELHVILQVTLTERATGRVLFQNSSFEVKETYQISKDPGAYYEESEPALRRASERTAQRVVTAILENF